MADIPLENARPNGAASNVARQVSSKTRGIPGSAVFEALVLTHARLAKRRCLMDRRDNGAGGRVGRLPGVDGERLETELRLLLRH